MVEIILVTLLAGLAIPAGGALALIERIHPNWMDAEVRHSVISFGGGVLLSAVALVLVPDGADSLDWPVTLLAFVSGGAAFMWLDVKLSGLKRSTPQLIAMLADFIPEAIALGAMFASDRRQAILLGVLIALQNVPEGFNSYRELSSRFNGEIPRTLRIMTAAALLGPACGLAGYFWLSDQETIVGLLMLFAAGGILYLTFEDIAPQARLENRHAPAFGAILGFGAGLLGYLVI